MKVNVDFWVWAKHAGDVWESIWGLIFIVLGVIWLITNAIREQSGKDFGASLVGPILGVAFFAWGLPILLVSGVYTAIMIAPIALALYLFLGAAWLRSVIYKRKG